MTMSEVRIIPIVEGHGEIEAVPVLIRRIARDIDPGFVPHVLSPIRVHANLLLKAGGLERSINLAALKLGGVGGIVLIIDCDWENCCPAKEGPSLKDRARNSRPDMPIAVILAKKEYEAWFIAAISSLKAKLGLTNDLESPEDPESIRDAKGWINNNLFFKYGYSETEDQPTLTELFDMAAARCFSDSFDKCYREIRSLLELLRLRA